MWPSVVEVEVVGADGTVTASFEVALSAIAGVVACLSAELLFGSLLIRVCRGARAE